MKTPVLLLIFSVVAAAGIIVGYTFNLMWILGRSLIALALNLLSWRDFFRDGG